MKSRKSIIIIIAIIILIIVLSVSIILCSSLKHPYKYPGDYSAEFCFDHYELFDPNIQYTECYEFVRNEKPLNNHQHNFSAIKDCDDLSFMVYYRKAWFLGPMYSIQVVRKNDCNVNPSVDYTPSNVELFWYNSKKANPEGQEWNDDECYYLPQYMSKTVIEIDKTAAIDEVMNIASKDIFFPRDTFQQEKSETVSDIELQGIYSDYCELYVKVSFEECAGLVFIGKIMVDDSNHSYLRHIVYSFGEYQDETEALRLQWDFSGGHQRYLYYRLGRNTDDYVRQAIQSISS